MRNTLAYNSNLITDILEFYYIQNLSVKSIYRKIKTKLSINTIYNIISKYKLYEEYKNWYKKNVQKSEIVYCSSVKNEILIINTIKNKSKSNNNKEK
ncbi:hypothetical protein IJE86_04655 [bacterium]|nr:hypothetical protein [bacterium]